MAFETLKNTDTRECMKPIGPLGGKVPQNINGNTNPPKGKSVDDGDLTKRTISIDTQGEGNTAQGMKKSGGNTDVATPTLNR